MKIYVDALIRYKTIDDYLFGGKQKRSIHELINGCAETIQDARGPCFYPENTIKKDLKVMRSDILGFNAPIKQEGGLYFYSDPQFSICNLRINTPKIANAIYLVIMNLRPDSIDPELETIIEELCRLTKRKYRRNFILIERSLEGMVPAVLYGVSPKDQSLYHSLILPLEPPKQNEDLYSYKLYLYEEMGKNNIKNKLTWGKTIHQIELAWLF
jgi:hypothetical protein